MVIRTRSAHLAILAISFLFCQSAHAQAVLGGDWRSDVDRIADKLVDMGAAPGIGLAIVQDDWVLYTRGFGVADMDAGRRVDTETAFYIASSTKALTATAVVTLADRGLIDLHAPITTYMPELRFQPPLDAGSITVHDLLTMTHGIRQGMGPVVFRTAFTGDFTRAQLIDALRDYDPSSTGRRFAYGNLGYNLLGMVLESTGSESWKEVVRQEVLDPFGMDQTTGYVSRVSPERLAQPHGFQPDGFGRIRLRKADANMHAAGGHFATARDLARFISVHLTGKAVGGGGVLPHWSALRATQRQHVEQDRQYLSLRRFGWGYGWDLGTYEGDTVVHRHGGFSGYHSHMSFMPEHGIGVVVLVNGDGPTPFTADLLATYVYDRLRGKAGVEDTFAARIDSLGGRMQEARRGLAAHLAERKARLAPLSRPLEHYTGIYENARYGRMEWRVVANGLEVQMGVAGGRAEVFDASEDMLRAELAGGNVLDFEFPPDGGPASSLIFRTGPDGGEEFLRVGN